MTENRAHPLVQLFFGLPLSLFALVVCLVLATVAAVALAVIVLHAALARAWAKG